MVRSRIDIRGEFVLTLASIVTHPRDACPRTTARYRSKCQRGLATLCSLVILIGCFSLLTTTVRSASSAPSVEDLREFSIEELANLEITSG